MAKGCRGFLNAYLSLTDRAKISPDVTYSYVLTWKGAVFMRQRWVRLARTIKDPELMKTFAELESTASRLAAFVFAVPDPKQREAWQRQIVELTARKEQLEAELARQSSEVRAEQARRRVTPADIQKSLPAGTVLIGPQAWSCMHSVSYSAQTTSPSASRNGAVSVRSGRMSFSAKRKSPVPMLQGRLDLDVHADADFLDQRASFAVEAVDRADGDDMP